MSCRPHELNGHMSCGEVAMCSAVLCVVNHQLKVTVLPMLGHPYRVPTGIEVLFLVLFVQFIAPEFFVADSGGRC